MVMASLFVFLSPKTVNGIFSIELGIRTGNGISVQKSFDAVPMPSSGDLRALLAAPGTRTNLLVIVTGTKTCMVELFGNVG